MFCRISLGEHKVTLNEGERLVVTYALTEYAGASRHQAIADLHLVDSNGDPIKFKDENDVEHTIGAIARTAMCDGKYDISNSTTETVKKLPGDFYCIYPTADRGHYIGKQRLVTNNNTVNGVVTPPVYCTFNTNTSYFSGGDLKYFYDSDWNVSNTSITAYFNSFRLAYSINLYNGNTSSTPNQYNTYDSYGFPNINTETRMTYGSNFVTETQKGNGYLSASGRIKSTTDFNPYKNCTGTSISYVYLMASPIIKSYTRGNFYRDQEWIMPTYQPNTSTSSILTLPTPRETANIYWINIRGMLYKIGYYLEEGNIDQFVPCPIKKKRGQVFKITFREYIRRHIAGT